MASTDCTALWRLHLSDTVILIRYSCNIVMVRYGFKKAFVENAYSVKAICLVTMSSVNFVQSFIIRNELFYH